MIKTDSAFTGSLPEIYGDSLVPIFFEPYAKDLASRLKARQPAAVLETAAGTGVVTRCMDDMLPLSVKIVATDLNQAMLDKAGKTLMHRKVEWQQADALKLPFSDGAYDAVVCQFGVMFFPDRPAAYAEAYRVLKPGGIFLFNVWDDIAYNDFSDAVNAAMDIVFPANPPRFLPRTPYSYHDENVIANDLAKGGFKTAPRIETISYSTTAPSPETAAAAICRGTPLRNEIDSRNPALLDKAVSTSAGLIAKRFGNGIVEGKLQAKIVEVIK